MNLIKGFISVFIINLLFVCAFYAQEPANEKNSLQVVSFEKEQISTESAKADNPDAKFESASRHLFQIKTESQLSEDNLKFFKTKDHSSLAVKDHLESIKIKEIQFADKFSEEKKPALKTDKIFERKTAEVKFDDNPFPEKTSDQREIGKFHWKPALIQSGIFLTMQHALRMTEEKTRRELGGPFFRDWKESVKNLKGWDDGGKFFTNYIAHPLQGTVTGRIFVNNSDAAQKAEFGKSKKYWKSRMKAMAWSAAWSLQFEIGPISEASLGNVGQKNKAGRSPMAWGDIVITPVLGTGFLIAEDAVEKYFLKQWVERKVKNKFLVYLLRTFATPTKSFSNLLRGKAVWHRDRRKL